MVDTLRFTVDSRLLEELGERLVGRPSTALAELVKNSYDADATLVTLFLDTFGEGKIEVRDNGHGMTREEFEKFWMRLGSQHKREVGLSRRFKRPFTGSKGVGRIAAQLLSRTLTIESVSVLDPKVRLIANLDWDEAIQSGELIDATVGVKVVEDEGADAGTSLVLRGLKQDWNEESVRELAQEIWQLQPPFQRSISAEEPQSNAFRVRFQGPEEDLVEVFDTQMRAILSLWTARAVGANSEGEFNISLQFKGEDPLVHSSNIDKCELHNGSFELRFYELQGRQPLGIRVGEARDYLRKFGGVHIYDTGFRLPFYGEKDNDWLLISYETARRITTSELLPEVLRVERGLLSLPQWSQVIGAVEINTAEEPGLEVTITRDRLVEGPAYKQLRDFVRRAIHWYANEKARRKLSNVVQRGSAASPGSQVARALEILDEHRSEIPQAVADDLGKTLRDVQDVASEHEAAAKRRIGALGSLATAGMATLGYQHEINKQLLAVEDLANKLQEVVDTPEKLREAVLSLRDSLLLWVNRAREVGRMFSHLTDPENLEEERRYSAIELLRSVVKQLEPVQREAEVDFGGIAENVRLPKATYTEWVSVFQNCLLNALNAMVDSRRRVIRFRTETTDESQRLVIEDTGAGVDPSTSETLFEPFERRTPISPERRELGFGGTGLGLTIVRMIAGQRGFRVFFDEPSDSFSTALVIEWNDVG